MSDIDTSHPESLAARLRRHDQVFGLIVKMPNPAALEVAGHLGFDFAVIDTEHGPGDTSELEHHIRAADSAGLDVIVRVGTSQPLDILRALDAGAKGVIVPHVNTRAEAEAAVAAAHYPPLGTRGLAASTRAGRHSTGTLADHLRRARSETVVIVQVEDVSAVENAAAIAATPNLDAVWLGPGDLSMSLGHPGEMDHPEVAPVIDRLVTDITTAQGAVLCVVVDGEDEVPRWRARGASMVLFIATNLQTARLRELLRNLDLQQPGLRVPLTESDKDRHAAVR
jgi:4-hydroxy-2-oxoheptanedioate aldolase